MKIFSNKLMVAGITCFLVCGCVPGQQLTGQKMENYAKERYLVALEYMEQSRFELASQQFAVAAKSAETSKLEELAWEGYEKANRIISGRR